MRKPAFHICENKGAEQLRSYCAADQLRPCFLYIDSTIPLLVIPPVYEVYRGYIVFAFSVCVCVCVYVNFFFRQRFLRNYLT